MLHIVYACDDEVVGEFRIVNGIEEGGDAVFCLRVLVIVAKGVDTDGRAVSSGD